MPGPETQAAPETKEAPKNSFELNVTPDAQKLMAGWKMDIKGDRYCLNNIPGDSRFDGTKKMDISEKNGQLTIKEEGKDGSITVYRGSSPEELIDNTMYVGYMRFIEGNPTYKDVPMMLQRVGAISQKYPGNPNFTPAAIHATE